MTRPISATLDTMRLGNYQPLLELASGGMATVYVARQVGGAGFERLVVIKRVHPHLRKDRAFTDMFLDEARMCSTIRHPNVVPVIDVVDGGNELFLVLEYIESLSLYALLQGAAGRGEKVPPAIVSRILVDALAGLHAAHEAVDLRGNKMDLIHRDVSPQNIIVGTDGTSRLIDFGIAKAASRITTTRDGVVKGKLRYMSLEQVRQKPLDRRADVFAAGVVLHEALTGERLFAGEDAGDIAIGILVGDAPAPSSLVPSLTPEVDAVVAMALATQRDERYATAAALQEALERALSPAPAREVASFVEKAASAELERHRAEVQAALESNVALPAVDAAPPEGRPTAVTPRRRSRAIVYLVSTCAAVVAIGAAATVLARRSPTPDAPGPATPSGTTRTAPTLALSAEPPALAAQRAPPSEGAAPAARTEAAAPTLQPTASASPSARPPRKVERVRPAAATELRRKNPYGAP